MIIIICFFLIGVFVGFVFTMFLINFDGKWKLVLESIFSIGGSGLSISLLTDYFNISDQSSKLCSTSGFIIGFVISVISFLFMLCKLIKDKDDNDLLRIRDILLGQKSYIKTYYAKRESEIASKLPDLVKRENEIIAQEKEISNEKKYLEEEFDKLKKLGNNKLKFILPEKKSIILTKEYIEAMPSYINDIFKCINDMNLYTQTFLNDMTENNIVKKENIKSYFISILTYITQDIFGNKSSDVRVHFRYYDEKLNGYNTLVAMIGNKIITKPLTFIPYGENTMIKKSYECKRALIKSINSSYDYKSDNYTIWQDYLTFTFYNLKYENKPYLAFGISVKNEERYKKIFHFMNFFKLELYLQENIETIDEKLSIKGIIYGGKND